MSKFSYFPKDKTKTGYGRCEPEDINMLGNELINTINSANLTPSMNETDQLAKSISNYVAKGTFCKDITTDYAHINLQIQSPFKAPNTYYDGMIITFLPMNINLANATVNVNGLGEKPIREKIDKEGIAVGVIAQNQYIQLIYNKSLDSFIIFQTQNRGEEEGGNLIVGQIISVLCSSSYIPFGCLPCNGLEYDKTSFKDLWTNYLTTIVPLLQTCTYEEYASDIAIYGQCAKFAIDTQNQKFKVPTIKDGSYITQAKSDTELGKSYNESLPNIRAKSYSTATGTTGNVDNNTVISGAYEIDSSITTRDLGSGQGSSSHCLAFNASLSSSTYQDDAKVQGDNVRLRFFVVVANGKISESQIDWSELQNKVNKDGSNVDENFFTGATFTANTVDYIIERGSNENGWYEKYKSGKIRQGGQAYGNDTYSNTLTFPTPFANTNYCMYGGSAEYEGNISKLAQGAWLIRYFTGDKTTTNIKWQALFRTSGGDAIWYPTKNYMNWIAESY